MIAILLALSLSLPVGEAGPLFNVPPFAPRDEQAVTNAAAHVGWALAIPLLGKEIGGKKGFWVAGGAWVVGTLVQESAFHPAHGPEVRTDLVTRLVPTLVLMTIYLLRST